MSILGDAKMFREFTDWFVAKKNSVVVVAAGNSGTNAWIDAPGDAYNVISVGAVGSDYQTRANYSLYRTEIESIAYLADQDTSKDYRQLPHILAPGGDSAAPMHTGSLKGLSGTSFASPFVAGIAALLAERQAKSGANDLRLRFPDAAHLAYKAIILNSARKRFITGENAAFDRSYDNAASKTQPADLNYIKFVNGVKEVQDGAATKTDGWTPSNWKLSEGNVPTKTYKAFLTDSPLDDEQGAGIADAKRALIQYNGGDKLTTGKQVPNDLTKKVTPIGWNLNELKMTVDDEPTQDKYTFGFKVTKGRMITATLAWDANVRELQNELIVAPDRYRSGNGEIEKGDRYEMDGGPGRGLEGTKGLADYRLQILKDGQVVAESGPYFDATTMKYGNVKDVVGHLHIPAPENGEIGEYAIQVVFNRRAASQREAQPYSLAWWVDDSV